MGFNKRQKDGLVRKYGEDFWLALDAYVQQKDKK
jgi:hypothetical protein